MKKILMLGNHEIVIYNFRKELIQKLIKNGNEVYVSFPKASKANILINMGCKFIDTPVDRRGTNPVKDLMLFLRYVRIIAKIKPDLVLTYTIKPNIYGSLASRFFQVPYINNVTGLGKGFENGGIIKVILKKLVKLSFRSSKMVFFQNTDDLRIIKEIAGVRDNYKLIPGSGVNLVEYQPLKYPSSSKKIRFDYIARIAKHKGIEEYLKVAELIKRKHPEIGFYVTGFIDGKKYSDLISDYSSRNIINYLGFTDNVKEVYEKSFCIINPSYTEGMSNTLLEGAACERPIIASHIPGCKEIIDEGVNGYTFTVKDINSLAKSIEKFIQLPHEEKKLMGMAGSNKVRREFDRNIVIEEYLKAIDKIIN